MKKTSGFTLVELIVVIAILAILAGIAIPVYSGYIAKAKEANDIQAMDAIKTATVFVKTEASISSDVTASIKYMEVTSSSIKAGTSSTDATALTDDELKEVAGLCGMGDSFSYTFKSGKTTATWDGTTWKLS